MLISLVIPTRERAGYLGASLDAALSVEGPGLEIVVCDNASTDSTQEVIAARAGDDRLRVVRQERRVSMRQNFETGWAEARGDYLIFIGDDDSLLPGQFPILRHLLETRRPDVLSWTHPGYGWPLAGFSRRAGRVRLERDSVFGAPAPLDAAAAREGLMRGEWRLMPSIYHGAVSRRFLDRIAAADGEVFGGSVPDVYFGMRAIFEPGEFLFCRHPFSINGYGPASNGHATSNYASGDARAAPARRFAEEVQADPLADAVGYIPSIAGAFFVTLETVLLRMNRMNEPPDRAVWYARVLAAIRPGDEVARIATIAALSAHAKDNDATEALARAQSGMVPLVPAARLPKPGPLSSFVLTARRNGRNDVQTAAETFDLLLRDDHARVLEGAMSRNAAWRAARNRAIRLALARLGGSHQ